MGELIKKPGAASGFRRFCLVFGVMALLLFAAGCGKKTDPRPPEEILPAPIADLDFVLDERGIKLSWTVPRRTLQGERLPYRVKKFQLYRAVVPEAEYRAEEPPPFGRPLTVRNEIAAGERLVYRETQLLPGHRYLYQVRSRAGWLLASAPSNRIAFTWLTPPGAPGGLTAEAGDRLVGLRWQPPREIPVLAEVPAELRYRIYRSDDGEDFRVLAQADDPDFIDREVVGGRTYYYRVQARAVHDESQIAGPVGETVRVVARDLTPPPVPTLEAVVPVREGVRLLWEMPEDGNIVEFVVLRRLAGEEESREIGRLSAPALSYLDRRPPAAADTWYYRLVAVDAEGNRSEAGNELPFNRP
ncbi:fibronectin type III domain-containing protein [Desulfurivibrio dismutans]|uniref:fibronectin type III domain-containing protein n=1 Tax=Desulfurivibrio dismutans TaxID=1398908 RepID=UPI0023D9ECC0|nr:hypothetical protein [Desulfurivibrio alkaliphilus]MDF1613821.1 hypothetical protein [Desulfurivibrio alkaliphilus]